MTKISVRICLFICMFVFCGVIAQAHDWYVAPNGSSQGNGSLTSPWDLWTALGAPAGVQPGDTIWVRGGTYSGTFSSYLSGTSSSPIVVRQYPGERATIAGMLVLGRHGDHDAWFWGIEVFNRGTSIQGDGVTMSATGQSNPGLKLINMVIHDNQINGVGFWSGAVQGEIYGTLIYNNGYDGCVGSSCRGHGHGLYVQSADSHRMADNIVFRNFSEGTQLYGTINAVRNNVTYEGNVFFNSGELSALNNGNFNSYNMWIGGDQISQNTKLINNYGYSSAPSGHNQYYNLYNSNNAIVTGNYFFTPAPDRPGIFINSTSNTGLQMTGNTFYGTLDFTPSKHPNNTYLSQRPTGKDIFVRPNQYETGRANIVIYNWDLSPSVSVDISASGLHSGQSYEIRDSQNFYGAPVATGVYNGGPVTIPMSNLTLAPPEGTVPTQPRHTAPEFDVFVLLPTGSQPADRTPPTVSILSPVPNQTVSSMFNVTATASDNRGIASVQFKLDGANLGSPLTSAPYQTSWNTKTASNASHLLTAVATDTSNNLTSSTAVSVTVNNPSGVGGSSGSLTDTLVSDFSAGSNKNTYISQMADGELIQFPAVATEFSGTALPSGWTVNNWSSGGRAVVNGGTIAVDGALVGTSGTYPQGRSLDFVATFTTEGYQHVGFGVNFNSAPWAIFSTGGGGSLMARSNNGSRHDTVIRGNWLGTPHHYRIDWNAANIVYWIDGVQVVTHPVAISTAMRPLISDLRAGGQKLVVDWMHMSPYSTPATFTSRVLDAGAVVSWASISWTADQPTGTSLSMSVRTGNTPVPDGTWTAFTSVSQSRVPTTSKSRYIQYRTSLSTTDTTKTAVLHDVKIMYGPK
ncbi:MAG TPA: Ig-like domain-containing protein [Candidatus Acidoferrum sp.]|jgi:hypothetical protein|nr:Ig-like domain-containing protein [Candidatus Acidoferrum sp.]